RAAGNLKVGRDPPVCAGFEIPNLEFAGKDDREGGGLDAADRSDVAGAGAEHALGDRTSAVDADQPIALASAASRVSETCKLRAIAETLEGFTNALGRHGLHPGALY